MDSELLRLLLYWGIPIITGIVGFIMKSFHQRLISLEEKMVAKISEAQARQLMSDKLDPIHEDLTEIKAQVERILDYMIAKNG